MPIRDLLMTDADDLAIVNGDFAVVGGDTDDANLSAVRQAIMIRVRTFLGEWFLDEAIGVDWIGRILVKNPDKVVVRELIRAAIAEVPDVVEVIAADPVIDIATRHGSITYTVRTVYSSELLTGEITSPP